MQVIIEFINLLISGVQQIWQFLLTLPEILRISVVAFPPVLATTLIAGFILIILIRVLELVP